MTSLAERKTALMDRLAQLQGRLSGIEAELHSHEARDWEDLAIEREDDAMLERLGQDGQAEISRIRAALDRIAAGTYGTCVSCGAAISAARLDALPDTPHCRDCAA